MADSQLLPAMENVCGNDDIRPVMQHVFLTKETFVATNAHVMAWHDTKEYFDKDFIKDIPEDGVLIHKEDWSKLKKCSRFEWTNGMIKIHYEKKRPVIIEVETEKNIGKYPNWSAVIPTVDKEKPYQTSEIGVNPELLVSVKKAIKMGDSILKLTFTGKSRAILLSDLSNKEGDYNGLIMPVMVDSRY